MVTKKSILQPRVRNYVAEAEILTQSIQAENRHIRLNSEFAMHPTQIRVVPLPPLTQRPSEVQLTKENQDSLDAFSAQTRNQLARFYLPPNQKQRYPLTSNQQIGWFSGEVISSAPVPVLPEAYDPPLPRNRVCRVLLSAEGRLPVFKYPPEEI